MRDRLLNPGRLREIRKQQGLTLAALAAKSGISLSHIKNYLAGNNQPGDIYAEQLARALDCKIEDFTTLKPKAKADVA